jgi:hypothetical protein
MLTVARARVSASLAYDRALEAVSNSALNSVRGTIRELAETFEQVCARGGLLVESDEASILLTAMFPIARRVSGVTKSKNPSWFRAAESSLANDDHIWSGEEIAQNIRTISAKRPGLLLDAVAPRIVQHDSRRRLKNVRDVDAILTSPPYVTRIDYVRATLPELMLLEHLGVVDSINKLRRTMLGTPLTTARSQRDLTALPPGVRLILDRVATHESKASGTYYHRFFSAYFFDLQTSLSNVCRTLKLGGRLCTVVQASHYKEIRIDLALLTAEILRKLGVEVDRFVEFDSPTSIVLVNRRAHSQARVPQRETAIFASKTGRQV